MFNGERISSRLLAWSDPSRATEEDWREAIRELNDNDDEPLLVIPIWSPQEELALQGVLWIPPRATVYGDAHLDIYVKRMFVMSDDGILLPKWARFIMGMINSNSIRRIVSGNTIKEDKSTAEARQFLKSNIIEAFRRLRSLPEEEYWKIIGPHDDTIKESAVDNAEFMECVWDKLRVRVRSRRLTIPEYLSAVARKTGRSDVIYHYDEPTQEFSANLVSDSTGIPVLCLCDRANDLFVHRVCDNQNLELVSFRALAATQFETPEDDQSLRPLVRACAESNIAAEIRSYEPAHIPAVLFEDKTMHERREDLLNALKNRGRFREQEEQRFVKDLEKLFERENAANRGVEFYLNSKNDLIKALPAAPFETQAAICLALYNISYMSAMPSLKKTEVQAIYGSLTSVLMALLKQTVASSGPPSLRGRAAPRDECRPTRMFMLTPFNESHANIEKAVRMVFEGEPYFFEVKLARDVMYDSRLLENIRAHIARADAFIADITEVNPNVMLELGATLVNNDGRPVFALRGRNATRDVPEDLKEVLYISYDANTDDPSKIAQALRTSIELNGKPSHREIIALLSRRSCRALSRSLLEDLPFKWKEEQIDAILRSFSTIEAFLGATELVAERVRMRPKDVETIKDWIKDRLGEAT